MVTDTVADLIIHIKNAGLARKPQVSLPYSKFRRDIAQKLRVQNFVADVQEEGHGLKKRLLITLSYDKDGKHKVHDVKRISKPGCRIYATVKEIHPIKHGHGVLILSTPKGVLTGQEARKEHVGGEVLFSIW